MTGGRLDATASTEGAPGEAFATPQCYLAIIATLAIAGLGAYATTTQAVELHLIFLLYASIMLMIWLCSAIGLFLDQGYNRSLPGCIESHLASSLDEEDWEQLHQAALQYPAIRPWIMDCVQNGELTYRDAAEPLFQRVHRYITETHVLAVQPDVPLNSQQKLQLLLHNGALREPAAGHSAVYVTARSDTTGRRQVSIHGAGANEGPPSW